MRDFKQTYEAAWVRWLDGVGYGDGEARALAVITEIAARRSAPRILLTGVKVHPQADDPLAEFLRGGHNATSRSHGRVRGPVLAHRPNWKLLDVGRTLAGGNVLCVLERPDLSMEGWARQVEAVDLVSGETAEPFTTEQNETLAALAFEGYNGYSGDTSKAMARHYLDELASLGLHDRATVLGALAARGVSVAGLGELAKLDPADVRRPSVAWASRRW